MSRVQHRAGRRAATQLRICGSKTIWAVRFRLLPQSNVHTEVQERVGLTLSDRKVII